ncbi:Hypothetical_protein [Hexamita inflata]|uniref:Hypothetical_protein n=1 Tax=Hexamita inflata TaxID=28002 RepID=A0AA86Q229_9EUKA|nr:Hypothetical protein HINF_LOCUS38359 [Hexamita inflata]CAI9951039.1 Hypothetical protein HINF_LOCUS38684 [Hexamita inflata]
MFNERFVEQILITIYQQTTVTMRKHEDRKRAREANMQRANTVDLFRILKAQCPLYTTQVSFRAFQDLFQVLGYDDDDDKFFKHHVLKNTFFKYPVKNILEDIEKESLESKMYRQAAYDEFMAECVKSESERQKWWEKYDKTDSESETKERFGQIRNLPVQKFKDTVKVDLEEELGALAQQFTQYTVWNRGTMKIDDSHYHAQQKDDAEFFNM